MRYKYDSPINDYIPGQREPIVEMKNLHPAARYTFKSSDPINSDLLHPVIGFVLDSYSLDLKRENARLDLVIY